MENHDLGLIPFNPKMDKLVENFLRSEDAAPELKTEYVKFVNICRRIGVYNVDLAWEVFYGALMLGFCFGRMALGEFK